MKMIYTWIILISIVGILAGCLSDGNNSFDLKTQQDENGYTYEYVTNDPLKTRIYTLKNGLKVYMTKNQKEPRIQGLIVVKAGSKNDPEETTGLAHYFEHMMFKGTTKIGSLNWEEEQVYIQQISDLFEQHRQEQDSLKKKAIYKKIDSLSVLAANYAVPGEYDKLMSLLGGQYINAFTSYDNTGYMANIPANELERWLKIESERFSDLVLRIFHTELETVYEEFNMYQDDDQSKVSNAIFEALFKNHPYKRDVIGYPKHIKNPSMVNIHKFRKMYYVPNNMAICLSGDIDYEKTIQLIDKYWGGMAANPDLPEYTVAKEDSITGIIEKTVYGPEEEMVSVAYRTKGNRSEYDLHLRLIDNILNNSKAGLFDLNLKQKQKVLSAASYNYALADYGIFGLEGKPREGQSLDEVKELLLAELEKVKKGKFDDWLIDAIINNMEISQIQQNETNWRAFSFMDAFVNNTPWEKQVATFKEMRKITKEDLMHVAQTLFKDNYMVVYKKTGEDTTIYKVDKPQITKIDMEKNRNNESEFFKQIKEKEVPSLQPEFVDFKSSIIETDIKNDIHFSYIQNNNNDLFYLYYIFDMGKRYDRDLALAVSYLPYLGTDQYSPEELQKELFKLGLKMNVYVGDERSYVYLYGLNRNFEKGMQLFEHVLSNVSPNKEIYDNLVGDILKNRQNNKKDQRSIFGAMVNYAKFGKFNPTTNIITEKDLKEKDINMLANKIKNMTKYKHQVFYYGPEEIRKTAELIKKYHILPENPLEIPEPVKYIPIENVKNKVYFVNYDKQQADILMLTKREKFDKQLIPYIKFFNEFYGSGLSSVFFQEIREAQGNVYTTYSHYSYASKQDKDNFLYAYAATQPDNIENVTDAMLHLLDTMPKAEVHFNSAKDAILKQIETNRITGINIFFNYLHNKDMGIEYDIRKDVYERVKTLKLDDMTDFFNTNIKNNKYTILILVNENNIDLQKLEKYSKVEILSLEDIFNY